MERQLSVMFQGPILYLVLLNILEEVVITTLTVFLDFTELGEMTKKQ